MSYGIGTFCFMCTVYSVTLTYNYFIPGTSTKYRNKRLVVCLLVFVKNVSKLHKISCTLPVAEVQCLYQRQCHNYVLPYFCE